MKKLIATLLLLGLVALGAIGALRASRLQSRVLTPSPPDVSIANATVSVERFIQSVRFQTISTQDTTQWNAAPFLEFHSWLSGAFPRVESSLVREVVNGYSLLYTWKGSDTTLAPILLTGHFDLVPVEAGTEALWKHPPFAGDTADGLLWGRGSADDKISVIGVLEGVDLLLGQHFSPTRTVLLAFGHDEELSGNRGAGHIWPWWA